MLHTLFVNIHAPEANSDQESPLVRESKTLLDSFSVELGFRIPQAKISRIPESGFPDIGRQDMVILLKSL